MAEPGQNRLHARHIAVMVGPPDVDHPVETALEFLHVVGDVGGEVGRAAVRLDQHPVLVVAVSGGAEPQRAVLFVAQTLVGELGQLGADHVAIIETLLAVPVVEPDPEGLQIVANPAQHLGHTEAGACSERRVRIKLGDARIGGVQLGRQIANIFALIAVFGESMRHAAQFAQARVNRAAERRHLVAGVVDVILALDIEARGAQHFGDRVAHGGAASVPDVQRPGRVGADELDLHLLSLAKPGSSEALLFGHDAVEHCIPAGRSQEKIDEAGAGDLDPGPQPFALAESADQGFGDLPRRLAFGACQ